MAKEDLGWSDYIKRDAQSDYPETIFRYIVEVEGLNILFYWFKDKNFYSIETGKSPVEVRRLYLNPNWDGKSLDSSLRLCCNFALTKHIAQ